ncbi:cytosine permease [Marmoricola endophyticus]|uniref:Cytosine permease n=1 Tax=Marmoricola endophyticus TaxID=2040280 RepID=A0A917EYM0_9ACTN|nr:cytosine permease [Marmoricola endophyticus]GGF34520.1 cytosine permease [Marmoricola endophyticus]
MVDVARPHTTPDEVPHTLTEQAPRTLGTLDQAALWGNLGVSLLGFTGAIFVLQPFGEGTPYVSLTAALVAVVVGTAVGAAAVAAVAAIGARTGAPTMVLLRGVFGARASTVPTVLNVVQMVGWGTFEIVTIATALTQVVPGVPRWAWVLTCGAATIALAVRPLGSVRLLRRWVSIAVVIALLWLAGNLIGQSGGLSGGSGGWSGFGVGVDVTLAVGISWVPMAADYARHSRTVRSAVVGAFAGTTVMGVACYAIGLVALVSVADGPDQVFASFLAVPLGVLAFLVVTVRELDQSFANVYATTVSTQALRPRWDRRVVSVVVGVLVTVLALAVRIDNYESFLYAIGSVFLGLLAVLLVDYLVAGRRWDLSETSATRWVLLLPWAAGIAAYYLIPPGPLVSRSLVSFLVAAAATGLVHGLAWSVRRTV